LFTTKDRQILQPVIVVAPIFDYRDVFGDFWRSAPKVLKGLYMVIL